MGVVAVGDKIATRVYCSFGNQVSITTYYHEVTAEVNNMTDTAIAAHFAAELSPLFKALFSPNARYEGVSCQVLAPTAQPAVLNTTGAGPGVRVVDQMPPQVAGLVSIYGPLAARTNRGRRFMPFPTEADNDADGKNNDNYQNLVILINSVALSLNTVVDGANEATLQPRHRIRKTNTYVPITQIKIRRAWSTHRTRNFLRGGDVLPS